MFQTIFFGSRMRFLCVILLLLCHIGWALCMPFISWPSAFALCGFEALMMFQPENFHKQVDNLNMQTGPHIGFLQIAIFLYAVAITVNILFHSLYAKAAPAMVEFWRQQDVAPWIPLAGYDAAWFHDGADVAKSIYTAALVVAVIPYVFLIPDAVSAILTASREGRPHAGETDALVQEEGIDRSGGSAAEPQRGSISQSIGRRHSLVSGVDVSGGKPVGMSPYLLNVYGSAFIVPLMWMCVFWMQNDIRSASIMVIISIVLVLDASRRLYDGILFTPESSMIVLFLCGEMTWLCSDAYESFACKLLSSFLYMLCIPLAFLAHIAMTTVERK